jgi:hypothetical protein
MAAPVTAVPLYISLTSYLNPDGPSQTILSNFSNADGQTANLEAAQPVVVPVSTTGYAVALATLFPSMTLPLFIAIQDVTVPGVGGLFYTHSGAASSEKQTLGPNGMLAWTPDGATPLNTIYFDNISSTSELVLAIAVASN